MNDTKNILLACASTAATVLATLDAPAIISIISAVVLPVVLFAVGKTVDVLVQIYLKRDKDRSSRDE